MRRVSQGVCVFLTMLLCLSVAKGENSAYYIPDGTKEIEDDYFCETAGIHELYIPASVNGFSYISNWQLPDLTAYIVDDASNTLTSKDGVLFSKDMTVLIAYPREKADAQYVLPNSVQYISRYAFSDNPYLSEVILGEHLLTIGEGAFYHCTGLESVKFGESLACIGASAFENTSIKAVDLPHHLVFIGRAAFRSTALVDVDIPDSVIAIEAEAFCNCYQLRSMTLPGSVLYFETPLCGWNNMDDDSAITLYIEENSFAASVYANALPDYLQLVLVESLGADER